MSKDRSEDDSKDTLTNIKVKEPEFPVSVSAGLLTVGSDFVQVAVDTNAQLCTFMFFQKHPTPKRVGKHIQFSGVHEELVLEVKVPMSTSFAMSEYMHILLKEIREGKTKGAINFGPTALNQGSSK